MKYSQSNVAYWVMCRAIEQDPHSSWSKGAVDQWFAYCEKEAFGDGRQAAIDAYQGLRYGRN